MTQVTETLAKDWDELVGPIANDLESSAKQYGALSRHRGFHSATDLLRAILIYAIALSLSATALWGAGLKLYNISRQALHRQVLKSTPWLHHLLGTLLRTLVSVPPAGTGLIHRLVLRDASTISRPGSPGTEWRLHLSWCPFQQQPAQVTLTDAHTGESFEDAALQAGDLVLADRAYGIWRTIRLALDSLAFFIVRLTWSNLPLCTPEGQPFNLIAWLRLLPETQTTAEITVVAADDPLQRPLRLVAGRLPASTSGGGTCRSETPSPPGQTHSESQHPLGGRVLPPADQSACGHVVGWHGLGVLSYPLANRMVFPSLEGPVPPRRVASVSSPDG